MITLLCAIALTGPAPVTVHDWGTLDGKPVHLYQLSSPSGAEVDVTEYGARIVRILVPDRDGKLGDVVAGYDDIQSYPAPRDPVFGTTVGRYPNRIAKGRFVREGRPYKPATNNGPNHLHGGIRGFDKNIWMTNRKGTRLNSILTV